jgi:hypothetical protein
VNDEKYRIIYLYAFHVACSGQRVSLGIGFDINQTRLRQKASTVNVDFSNPHNSGIGISAHAEASLKFGEKYSVCLRPGLSILETNSDVTSDKQFQLFNLSTEFGYPLKSRILINIGIEYGYLIRMLSKFNGPYGDWTFFANRRHFVYPVIRLGYQVDDNWSANFRFGYFLQDVFNSGALDTDGNIVGPVMVYPYTIRIGCTYRFDIKNAHNSKRHKKLNGR